MGWDVMSLLPWDSNIQKGNERIQHQRPPPYHPHKSKNTNDHFHLVACSQWMEEDIKPNITTSLLEDQIESCVSLWRPITHIQTTIPRTARTRATATLWYQTGQCCNKTTSSQPIVASLIGRMMTAGASTQAWDFAL